MKKGICPRCQSKEIFSGTQVINKSGNHFSNAIPVSFFRAAALDNFVCGQCGYVESYIAKEKDLATIKKKWPLVF
jgi:predicted nucleic-acid-binding Zn-ribbon protein